MKSYTLKAHNVDQYGNETFGELSAESLEQAQQWAEEQGKELAAVGYVWDAEEGVWTGGADDTVAFVVEEAQWIRADAVQQGDVFEHEGKRYDAHKVYKMGKVVTIQVNVSGSLVVRLRDYQQVNKIGEW